MAVEHLFRSLKKAQIGNDQEMALHEVRYMIADSSKPNN